jgi:hypothetical protein
MNTYEMMRSAMQEREREAARLQRQHQADRLSRPAATPRSGRSSRNQRKHPLTALAARIRAASVL